MQILLSNELLFEEENLNFPETCSNYKSLSNSLLQWTEKYI